MQKNKWIFENFNWNEKLLNILQGKKSEPPEENYSVSTHSPSQAPPIFLVINIEIDICFQIASRMQLLGVKKWCSANIFSDPRQKDVCWKFVKSERFLPVLREHIAFNVKWVEGCKMTFCWSGNFLLGNLKLKKLQLCPSERLDRYKNVACPKLAFSKN